jgi:ketol-acid reductoisomerase
MSRDLRGATVAVLGFGNQGEAHALNLRDSGARVVIGARSGGRGEARARDAGFPVSALTEAAAAADWVACLLADEAFGPLFESELQTALRPAATLIFAHGFNLLYREPRLEPGWDVVLVSPTGPGTALRAAYPGGGMPAYLAVHQDGSGAAWEKAQAYAEALGCRPTWRTTVREETEVDLFGEQAVLCGGMNALVTTAFETLVEAGYSPEIAYLECVHQLSYLAQALHERGVTGLRRGISGTALYGDLTRGPRVLGPDGKARLREILEEIRTGGFAREWLAASARGEGLAEALERSARHPIERARERAVGGSGTEAGQAPTGVSPALPGGPSGPLTGGSDRPG